MVEMSAGTDEVPLAQPFGHTKKRRDYCFFIDLDWRVEL
jgi:hypothetical protein